MRAIRANEAIRYVQLETGLLPIAYCLPPIAAYCLLIAYRLSLPQ